MSVAIKKLHKTAGLKAIQEVQMIIEVVNVSDVCTSDGRSMDTFLLLSKQKYRQRNGYTWHLKHHVLSTDYTVWRKLLKKIF